MKKSYTLLFVIILLLSKTTTTNAQANVQDSLALVDLYNSTDGPHWTHRDKWLTKAPVNQWYGVILMNAGSKFRVTQILLPNNQLTGSMPARLGNMDSLTRLVLINNQLSGSIPVSIGGLPRLKYLFLENNQLTGSIPAQLGNLSSLVVLNLSNNHLSGNIPVNLSNLPLLKNLLLNNNQLKGGIPDGLKNLKLDSLNLSYNQLSGSIPTFKIKHLVTLNLENNRLTGTIPSALGNLQSLVLLNLSNNLLLGEIPSSLGNLTLLQELDLTHNKLTGNIPDSLANLEFIQILNLGDNKLSGTLPSFLTQLPNLKRLNILHNHFTFDGLEALVQHNFDTLRYNNQRYIELHQNNNRLSVSAGGTLSNNTYKWFRNGFLIATIKGDSVFAPANSANYSVHVTNAIAKGLVLKSDTVHFSSEGLIANNLMAHNDNTILSVYPNPAKTTATLTFNATGNCTLKVTDASGRVLQTNSVAGKGRNMIRLDVSRYTTGVYFVTLTDHNNQSQTLQLSKQ